MPSELFSLKMDPQNAKAYFQINTSDIRAIRAIRQTFFWLGKDLYAGSRDLTKRGPRAGRIYKWHGKKMRASAPGEPPQRISGKLRESIGIKVQGAQSLTFGAKAPYASYLENGTSKMAQRPFLGVVVEKNKQNAIDIGAREFQKQFGPQT